MNIQLEPIQLLTMERIAKDYGYTMPELIKSLVWGFMQRQVDMQDDLDELVLIAFNKTGGQDYV